MASSQIESVSQMYTMWMTPPSLQPPFTASSTPHPSHLASVLWWAAKPRQTEGHPGGCPERGTRTVLLPSVWTPHTQPLVCYMRRRRNHSLLRYSNTLCTSHVTVMHVTRSCDHVTWLSRDQVMWLACMWPCHVTGMHVTMSRDCHATMSRDCHATMLCDCHACDHVMWPCHVTVSCGHVMTVIPCCKLWIKLPNQAAQCKKKTQPCKYSIAQQMIDLSSNIWSLHNMTPIESMWESTNPKMNHSIITAQCHAQSMGKKATKLPYTPHSMLKVVGVSGGNEGPGQ